jgi:hypothetical protein
LIKLLFILILFISAKTACPQDSLLNKEILTDKFDITINPLSSDTSIKNHNESYFCNDEVFKDCLLINTISDSGMYVHFTPRKEFVLFKNITEISFKGKNHNGTGLLLGTISGLLSGLGFSYLVFKSVEDNKRTINHVLAIVIAIPTFTIGGMIIGWNIGGSTYDRDTYDISKYLPDKKREKVLNIFFRKQINF